jgi:NADH:ubiquinone oxidoreductase subunit 6 (subunit J)
MQQREVLVLVATGALFAIMAISFVGIPWPTEPSAIPLYNRTSDHGVANSLFLSFPITVVLIALLLGSAMIGGIYLAKMDEPGKVGP